MKFFNVLVLFLALLVVGCNNEHEEIIAKKDALQEEVALAYQEHRTNDLFKALSLLAKVDINYKFDLATFYMEDPKYRDVDKALTMLEELSNENYLEAKKYIGSIYYNGIYVEKDLELAAAWYIHYLDYVKSPKILVRLATMYALGQGVEQDKLNAFVLLSEAVSQGYIPAFLLMRTVYYSMDPQEQALVDQLKRQLKNN